MENIIIANAGGWREINISEISNDRLHLVSDMSKEKEVYYLFDNTTAFIIRKKKFYKYNAFKRGHSLDRIKGIIEE